MVDKEFKRNVKMVLPNRRKIVDVFVTLFFLTLTTTTNITLGEASLTAHDPINTRASRTKVSHDVPAPPFPLPQLDPPFIQQSDAHLLLQETHETGSTLGDDDVERKVQEPFADDFFPLPPSPSFSTTISSSQQQLLTANLFAIPHQRLDHFPSSTPNRLFHSSSLRHSNPLMKPYVMKDYSLPWGRFRVYPPLEKPLTKSQMSTTLPKSSSPIPFPPSPSPFIPSSSLPPPPAMLHSEVHPHPSPTYVPHTWSSPLVFSDRSESSGKKKEKIGLEPGISGTQQQHFKYLEIAEGRPSLSFGFSSPFRGKANRRYLFHSGRDGSLSVRRGKHGHQRRMRPHLNPEEENNEEYHVKPQLSPELPLLKTSLKNHEDILSTKINNTATTEASQNYDLENWQDQLEGKTMHDNIAREEDYRKESGMSAYTGTREDFDLQNGFKDEERKEQKYSLDIRTSHKKDTISGNLDKSSYDKGSNGEQHESTRRDATKLLMTNYDNKKTNHRENNTEMNAQYKVSLETLQKELSKKDEEAASDLLLAISILQHHVIPNLDRDEDKLGGKSDNSSMHMKNYFETGENDYTLSSNSEDSVAEVNNAAREHQHNYNIEIFDAMAEASDEDISDVTDMPATSSNKSISFEPVHEIPVMSEREACYRWFVLVLDGNCSVIKQRMTAFVTFLKAALSSKLSVDYNDVYVPSVFCDNTFMVNISLDTIKNPQAEIKLRLLAEANTTLLEISEEIFYLEKILTKRSEEEEEEFQDLVKKQDDVELVIYIAVGCMVVFILLSVVIVALIRVCRQEGDPMDIGKSPPHHHITRPFDFPIRRPNVIYSHR
ncbi:hypothetical protein SK128_026648 [Halocaridina rubra]|uniref:Uncharacterized protein n=1 Tax=Halocaridina rubra TaxID=373956 RepID=A0AAN8WT75_HALRR